jgi:uncharacterized protein YneF (UPF0154 family)
MYIKLLIPALIILLLIILGMSIGIFFGKKKKFPEGSVSKNPELRKLGLKCAKHEELSSCGISSCCGGRFERELSKMNSKESKKKTSL